MLCMYYDTEDPAYYAQKPDPFKSCVVPRPIAWVTTCGADGVVNVAPFSYFNAVADNPPMVMIATGSKERGGVVKDTIRNIAENGQFVINMVPFKLVEEMNRTSAMLPYGVSELDLDGLATIPAHKMLPPRLVGCPIHLECVHWQTIELPCINPDFTNQITIGKVLAFHVDEQMLLADGQIDSAKLDLVARMGGDKYARVQEVFNLKRPPSKS